MNTENYIQANNWSNPAVAAEKTNLNFQKNEENSRYDALNEQLKGITSSIEDIKKEIVEIKEKLNELSIDTSKDNNLLLTDNNLSDMKQEENMNDFEAAFEPITDNNEIIMPIENKVPTSIPSSTVEASSPVANELTQNNSDINNSSSIIPLNDLLTSISNDEVEVSSSVSDVSDVTGSYPTNFTARMIGKGARCVTVKNNNLVVTDNLIFN